MRRCLLFRRTRDDDATQGRADEADEINEKRVRSPRDWTALFLTAIRVLQCTYFGLVCLSLRGFQRSSYFREDGSWHQSPDQMHRSERMMRWVRMQAAMTLIYHTVLLVAPCLRRLLRITRRPFGGLASVFGDGCTMLAMINIMVLLDSEHESYCHRAPARGDFNLRDMFSLGRENHHHDMSSHRAVCNSLDVVFGLGGLIVISHLVTAIITARKVRQSTPEVFAKMEQAGDLEQGIVAQRPLPAESSSPATPQRQYSPPPSYRSGVSEYGDSQFDSDERREVTSIPRGRSSIETTSSLGIENYLVSDGWRAPEQPPEYSSRPPSLHHASFSSV